MSDNDENIVEGEEPTAFLAKIKSIRPLRSEKPFLITTRDALIVAVITVLVIVILKGLYYLITGNVSYMTTGEFWMGAASSFGMALAFQYAYEYAGFNAMLAESAMRYAKGSALSKYQSRNGAFVATIAAEEALAAVNEKSPDLDKINENLKRFNAMIKSTRQAQLIANMKLANPNISEPEILAKINARKEYLNASDLHYLLHLDPTDTDSNNVERLRASSRLIEIMGTNEPVIRYFMRNGFEKLKPKMAKFNNPSLDLPVLLEELGLKIKEEPKVGFFKGLALKVGKQVAL